MSQYHADAFGSVTLTETVAKNLRVMLDGSLAGATEQELGTALAYGVSGDDVGVHYANAQGTKKMVASGAISADANVYGAASGKISATQATGAYLCGRAMEAAAADGDVIEVLAIVGEVAGS